MLLINSDFTIVSLRFEFIREQNSVIILETVEMVKCEKIKIIKEKIILIMVKPLLLEKVF